MLQIAEQRRFGEWIALLLSLKVCDIFGIPGITRRRILFFRQFSELKKMQSAVKASNLAERFLQVEQNRLPCQFFHLSYRHAHFSNISVPTPALPSAQSLPGRRTLLSTVEILQLRSVHVRSIHMHNVMVLSMMQYIMQSLASGCIWHEFSHRIVGGAKKLPSVQYATKNIQPRFIYLNAFLVL